MLRVGEYTPTSSKSRKKRTIPLRKSDVRLFFSDGKAINPNATSDILRQAKSCAICLENQKNGLKDQTLVHEASGDPLLCPAKAMVILLETLRGLPGHTPLGTYSYSNKRYRIKAHEIVQTIRYGASQDNLFAAGFDICRLGSHSLRSGGAVRLKAAGTDDGLIKKLGRWSSDTYARYIQPHIQQLHTGLSEAMSITLRFTNMAIR